jgi:hypothetical protein
MTTPVTVVQERTIPASIRDFDAIRSDYIDLFAAMTGTTAASAKQWARVAVEGSPAAGRFLAWRVLCALRLEAPTSPDTIGGWRIVDGGNEWIRVEARSWFMTANMIFRLEQERLLFATLVRYDNPAGRSIWGLVSAIHRRVAPNFLSGAVARMRRGNDQPGGAPPP